MPDQQPAQKLAPNSQESEEALLGSILINPEIFDEMLGLVRVEDFYYMHHQFVFTALLDLRARGFDVAVVDVSPLPFASPGSDPDALAHRLWRLQREAPDLVAQHLLKFLGEAH